MSKTISALKTIYHDLCERGEIENYSKQGVKHTLYSDDLLKQFRNKSFLDKIKNKTDGRFIKVSTEFNHEFYYKSNSNACYAIYTYKCLNDETVKITYIGQSDGLYPPTWDQIGYCDNDNQIKDKHYI